MEEEKKKAPLYEDHLGVFLHRQLISAARFVAVGSWGSKFCIYLQTQCSMSGISRQEKKYSRHCNFSLKLNI